MLIEFENFCSNNIFFLSARTNGDARKVTIGKITISHNWVSWDGLGSPLANPGLHTRGLVTRPSLLKISSTVHRRQTWWPFPWFWWLTTMFWVCPVFPCTYPAACWQKIYLSIGPCCPRLVVCHFIVVSARVPRNNIMEDKSVPCNSSKL